MFGSTQPTASTGTTGSTLGRSASFSFSQPPANKPFSGTSGGFSFGGGASASTATCQLTAAAPAPAAGGFGGFGAAKPATGGSFASSATTTTSQPAASGGLFGGASSSQPPAGGGLFGSTSSSQPQASGGLFGSSTALVQQQPQQQQQQPAAGGGLFGSSSQPPAGGATGGTGLFGSSTQGGGLFGSTNNQQQQQQPTGFGFGSSTTGLFGSSTNNAGAQGGGFGQSFQAGQSQQAAASPFARFGYHQKERFNDLPEDARKPVEELDKHITSQIQTKDELKTKDFGSEIRKCAAKWHELDSALKSISATLESDSNQARDVAERVERDRSDNATLYAIATNAREGRSDASGFIEWLQKYFVGLAEEFRERMQRYWSVMETIERHLQSLDQREQFTPQAISNVIHAQHVSFMSLAAEVASLHSEVETLKKDYAKWYKQTYKSFRDPFGSMNQLSSSVPP